MTMLPFPVPIKRQPGDWLDWNGGDPVVRNKQGEIIEEFPHVHISAEAYELLKDSFGPLSVDTRNNRA